MWVAARRRTVVPEVFESAVYRSIVLALDPAGRALPALPVVTALARESGGAVHVVTVADGDGAALSPRISLEVRRMIGRATAAGVDASAEVVTGVHHVDLALADAARRHGADLVALGAHGRTNLGALLRGSVGVSLAARLDVPLLLVHGRGGSDSLAPGPIRRVVVAVDRHAESDAALDAGRTLAAEHEAAVLVVHVPEVLWGLEPYSADVPPQGYAEERGVAAVIDHARRRLAGLDTAVETRVVDGEMPVAALIANAADEWGSDVIVVGSRRRSPLGGLVAGSVSRELVRRTGRPVLIAGRPVSGARTR